MKTPKIKSITIIGRRWFDKVNGNTYFSSVGLLNGKPVVSIPFEYGYSSQYEHETWKAICKEMNIDSKDSYGYSFCQDNNIAYYCTVSDVSRRKDLKF